MRTNPVPASASLTCDHDAESWVVRGTLLDQWLAHSWQDGVRPDELENPEVLRVCTRNTAYELAVVSSCGAHMLVRGGRYFPEWTPVYFLGCSLGGGLLKRHALHPGLRMEFYWAGRRVVTSPVQSIAGGAAARPSAMPA